MFKWYPIEPMGAPRQTRADAYKGRPVVLRYRAYKDEIRLRRVEVAPRGAHILFVLPMPASWSKRKKRQMNSEPHESVPDIDNLAKGLLDALFDDDAHISDIRISKQWGHVGGIWINNGSAEHE